MDYQVRFYYTDDEAEEFVNPEMVPEPQPVSWDESEPEDDDFQSTAARRPPRNRSLRRLLPVAVVIVLLAVGAGMLYGRWEARRQAQLIAQQEQQRAAEQAEMQAALEAAQKAQAEAERQARLERAASWEMLLATPAQPLEQDPEIELAEAPASDQLVDARIMADLTTLLEDARQAGFDLVVTVGYRDWATQESMFARYVRQAERRGLTGEDARAAARAVCAEAGASDHQTGLGVHLIDDGCQEMSAEAYAATDAYGWLLTNSADYGFVLRYPADKTETTGFAFEPWHFRYVGRENAQQMKQLGLCLDEYAAWLTA